MATRPFAVFDIDGTLIRWQLFHAIVDELGRQGHVSPDAYQTIHRARTQWKHRSSQDSFRNYEHQLVKIYDQAVANLPVNIFLQAVRAVFEEYKDQTYAYTRDLIGELKTKSYLLFAISGSQQEVVKLLSDYYGFDDYAGSIYQQIDGRFTGQYDILRAERKISALEAMVAKHGASHAGSLAIGDSEGDIPMLEYASDAIAFNPTQTLFEYARDKNWKVVVERKNMIYKLEPSHGSYLLA